MMTRSIKIDFVSDVSCPWCAIGLAGLERALEALGAEINATIQFQPFELNPNMPFEGQNIVEHVAKKYGSTLEQSQADRAVLRARAASVGFDMAITENSRIYNTFDAHRLLHWAHLVGDQKALKHALFDANFTQNRNVGDRKVLLEAVATAGLDVVEAGAVLSSVRYSQAVRDAEKIWKGTGITSVPAVIIDDRHRISGGQPTEYFQAALREIAKL